MSDDYRDDMTLEEVAANDMEMVKVAIKNSKRHKFFDREKAFQFTGHCVKTTLDRLGVKIRPGIHPKIAERLMKTQKVIIEGRKNYRGEDIWRNGIYIYKSGELAAFVSNVFEYKRPSVAIAGDPDHFWVVTNAKV